MNGNLAREKVLRLEDMRFVDDLLRFDTFCEAKGSRQHVITLVAHWC